MKKNKLLFRFVQELLLIFTDYSITLDEYFKLEENKNEHHVLYSKYLDLKTKLDDIAKRYKI